MPVSDKEYARTWYADTLADLTVERAHVSRGPGYLREHRVVELHEPRRSPSPRETRRPSRSANPREMVLSRNGHRRRNSVETGSDFDYDSDGSSPRRVRSPRHYDRHHSPAHPIPIYANPPKRSRSIPAPQSRSQRPPGRPPRRYYSDSDSSSDDDEGKKEAQPKPPSKQILYTGLACVATLAAANGIYQSAKAHHTRQKELEEGDFSGAEAEKLKAQARKMDLISLGVAAVGAYNVRNGWRRAEGHWKAHKERQTEERK